MMLNGLGLKVLRYAFNAACFFTAFGMTVYWCYRFWMDEDLCMIDFVPFEKATEVQNPMISVCFEDNVLESKLKAFKRNITAIQYVDFLRGMKYIDGFNEIKFEDVTRQLGDFYLGDGSTSKNGIYTGGMYPNLVNSVPQLTFVGFWYMKLLKCYGLQIPNKNLKAAYFGFNSTSLPNSSCEFRCESDHCEKRKNIVFFHLPNQILLSAQTLSKACLTRAINVEHTVDYTITYLEVLKRRDKSSDPCMPDLKNYDRTILDGRRDKIGCRAPYQNTTSDLPLCTTKQKLSEAIDDMAYMATNAAHLVQPCVSIGDIRYSRNEYDFEAKRPYNGFGWKGPEWAWLGLNLPHKIKVVTQVKDVDFQTVIGNAGGYVGLFLGAGNIQFKMGV